MVNDINYTMRFKVENENDHEAHDIIINVYKALDEKGYNPVNQIVGYILSGDPTYITSHNNARGLIRRLERDEIIEELLKNYLKNEME